MSARRWPAVGAIVVLAASGFAADRLLSDNAGAQPLAVSAEMPETAPAAARSSAWFCAGATAEPGSAADGTVVIANAGRRDLNAVITVYPTMGEPRQAALVVGAARRASLRLGDLVVAPFASALVELDGGQAAVELEVRGPNGHGVTPCASSAAAEWYFAQGITTKDATEQLLVFNPFPDDAVVDFSFTTDEERTRPLALTGVAVAGHSMLAVNVGEFVPRRDGVTALVAARRGRIAVNRLQTFDGSGDHKGMALTLGAAGRSRLWYFATGVVADGAAESFHLYNPGATEAEVEIGVEADEGEIEPFLVTVPPESRLSIVAADESRIPRNSLHAVTVRSTNDVGLVVERTLDVNPSPAGAGGFTSSPGAIRTARRWIVVAGGADAAFDETISISNPGGSDARVSVDVLIDGVRTAVDGLSAIAVPALGRTSVRIADHVKGATLPLVVSANRNVVVERTLLPAGILGIASMPAIPMR